jgi:hypothetical protein
MLSKKELTRSLDGELLLILAPPTFLFRQNRSSVVTSLLSTQERHQALAETERESLVL